MTPPPPVSTLFPYTTLFRSRDPGRAEAVRRGDPERGPPRDLPREPRGGRGSRVAPRAAPGEPARAPAAGERPSAPSRGGRGRGRHGAPRHHRAASARAGPHGV